MRPCNLMLALLLGTASLVHLSQAGRSEQDAGEANLDIEDRVQMKDASQGQKTASLESTKPLAGTSKASGADKVQKGDGLQAVELRASSMRREPVAKVNLLEVKEDEQKRLDAHARPVHCPDTCPENCDAIGNCLTHAEGAHGIDTWTQLGLGRDDKRRQYMGDQALKFDKDIHMDANAHKAMYDKITHEAEKLNRYFTDDKFNIDDYSEGHEGIINDPRHKQSVLYKAYRAQHLSSAVAEQSHQYTVALKELQGGGQKLVNNLYKYHDQVDQDISRAVGDATLHNLEKDLEHYYVHHGGNSRTEPLSDAHSSYQHLT